jgi:hypothetical protein
LQRPAGEAQIVSCARHGFGSQYHPGEAVGSCQKVIMVYNKSGFAKIVHIVT